MPAILPSRRSVLATLALTAGAAALSGTGIAAAVAQAGPDPTKPRTRPVIFVVGDSTSSAYQQSERPRAGWGQASTRSGPTCRERTGGRHSSPVQP